MRLFTLLSLFFWATSSTFAETKDAVVVIYSTLNNGKGGLGSGFIISEGGDILTCYHVIKDATRLQVFLGKQMYSNVEVSAIAPERDLAKLRLRELNKPVPHIPLSTQEPGAFGNQPLETYGSTWIVQNQHLQIRSTSTSFAHSEDFRNQASVRLFALRQVDLITLDMTIYSGLSGAPLLFENKAVGVISGSIQEGGSLAWAIPSKYSDEMTPINKSASQIDSWPPLSLMASAWGDLRRQADLGVPLGVALDQYGATLDNVEDICRQLWSPRIYEAMKKAIDEEIPKRGNDAKVTMGTAIAIEAELLKCGTTTDKVRQLVALAADYKTKMDAAYTTLRKEVDDYFNGSPRTRRNAVLRKDTTARLQKIEEALKELDRRADVIGSKMDKLDGSSLSNFSRSLEIVIDYMKNIDFKFEVEKARDLQEVIENMLEAAHNLAPSSASR